MTARTRYRATAKEHELESTIIDGVRRLGGYAWHVRDSRKMNVEGMTDLIVVIPERNGQPGVVGLIEVKSQRRQVTDLQHQVVAMLAGCERLVTGIVRPNPKPGEMSLDECLERLGVETT